MLFSDGSVVELTLSEEQQVFLMDIESIQWAWNSSEARGRVERDKPLMSGQFAYHNFDTGLSMHIENAIEEQNSCNTFVLQSGLSFTFLFAGCIDVSFSGQQYQFKPKTGKTSCYAIVNNSAEVMTRKTCKDMYVKKLNIFVDREWLERRNACLEDAKLLSQIFKHKKVCHWQISSALQAKVERLMRMRGGKHQYAEKLELESLTMQLVVQCINELKKQLKHSPEIISNNNFYDANQSLKRAVENAVDSDYALAKVAAELGMSERTIQRKFKLQYGDTVSNFIKYKKMERAKRALLVDQKSIGEAAYLAGYNHTSNFVSAFKKSFGVTPSEYVRVHR